MRLTRHSLNCSEFMGG